MSQPSQATQELPAWLTYSTSVYTNAGGVETTSSTLLYLPLTYYGPSIPLGTDGSWVYGGLTSPPPEPTATSTTVSSPPTAPSSITSAPPVPTTIISSSSAAIPPTTSQSPSTSAIPTSTTISSSSLTSSATPTSSIPMSSHTTQTSSATPFPTIAPIISPSSRISRGAIAGIVSGSIFLVLALLFLLLCCLRYRAGRRNRRELYVADKMAGEYDPVGQAVADRYKTRTPKYTDWIVIYPSDSGSEYAVSGSSMASRSRGARAASPNLEGSTEADHLLSRSTDGMREVNSTAKLVSVPATAALGHQSHRSHNSLGGFVPSHHSNHSVGSVGSNDSGFGSVLPSQRFSSANDPLSPFAGPNAAPLFYQDPASKRGHIMSRDQFHALVEEEEEEQGSSAYGFRPLLPPPRLNHDAYSPASPPTVRLSTVVEDPYSPMPVYRRAAHSRASVDTYQGSLQESSELSTARRVNVMDLGPRSPPSSSDTPLPDAGPSSWVANLSGGLAKLGGLGLFRNPSDASRPNSYPSRPNSANSKRPSSYVGITEDLEEGTAFLGDDLKKRPVGLGFNELGQRPMSSLSGKSARSGATTYHTATSNQSLPLMEPSSRTSTPLMEPASAPGSRPISPRPLIDLATPPRSPSTAHLRLSPPPQAALAPAEPVDVLDSPAPQPAERFAARDRAGNPFYPPGLATPSGATRSGDVLEDEPPRAADAWASTIEGSPIFSDPSRRMTFGGHPRHFATASEQGSIYSGHLSPYSIPSAPGSRRALDGSVGSNSSRGHHYSHSQGRSGSSGASLAHSASISSDSHRRHNHHGPISPSLSAFGRGSPASFAQRAPLPPHFAQPQAQSPLSFDQAYGTGSVNLNDDEPAAPRVGSPKIQSPALPFDGSGSAIGWWGAHPSSPPRRSGPPPMTSDQEAAR